MHEYDKIFVKYIFCINLKEALVEKYSIKNYTFLILDIPLFIFERYICKVDIFKCTLLKKQI